MHVNQQNSLVLLLFVWNVYRERQLIEGKENVDSNLHYQAVSQVRRKIEEELTTDVEIFRDHRPELDTILREAVETSSEEAH
ncbi:hypothetical protein NJ7G_1145 [Natrinema sp. J7-2]|nr:hypothetical protein NJ7G_1145 [Natrinema sp. J7-2]